MIARDDMWRHWRDLTSEIRQDMGKQKETEYYL